MRVVLICVNRNEMNVKLLDLSMVRIYVYEDGESRVR